MVDVISTKADFDAGTYTDTMSEEVPGVIPPDCLSLLMEHVLYFSADNTSLGQFAVGNVGGNFFESGQSFIVASPMTISKIEMFFTNFGGGGSGTPVLYATIVADVAGNPDTVVIVESNHFSFTISEGYQTFNFSSIELPPGTYWFVLQCEPGTPLDNYRLLRTAQPSSYPYGHAASKGGSGIWTHYSNHDVIMNAYRWGIATSGSWRSDERDTPAVSKIANFVFDINAGSGDANNYISGIDIIRAEDMSVVGTYSTAIQDDVTLTLTDFGITEILNFDWYFDVSMVGDSTTSIQLNSITTNFVSMSLYNAVLLDLKRAIVAEFTDFKVEIAGTSEKKRDANQPYIYVVPLNISTAFDPIGRETATGHGEGQIWNFSLAVITRRGIFVDGESESEMLREVGERAYKFLRNTEENLGDVFDETIDYLRYFSVGGLTTTLYNPETEEFRIDIDFRIEFNITR